jgi:membrane associated rhomboid family serine protease
VTRDSLLYPESLADPTRRLLQTCHALLDHTDPPGRLLGLGREAAAIAMADGSLVALVTSRLGPPEAIREHLAAIVTKSQGLHLKLVAIGGDVSVREAVRRARPRISLHRAVQTFHLGDDDALWVGSGTRRDSPMGRALARVAAGDLADIAADHATLGRRIQAPQSTPQEVAEHRERRAFAERLHASRLVVTPVLLFVLAVVFALEWWWGAASSPWVLVRMGANTPASLAGEPWRLLASTFLHGSVPHVLLNGWALWVLGGFVERVLGPARLLTLWVIAGACGSVASALLGDADLSVGASGALLGMLGAAAVVAFRPEGILPASVVPAIRRAALVNLALAGSMSFMPRVDLWAHLGGAVAGALFVLAVRTTLSRSTAADGPPAASLGLCIAAAVLVAAAVASLGLSIALGRPWTA